MAEFNILEFFTSGLGLFLLFIIMLIVIIIVLLRIKRLERLKLTIQKMQEEGQFKTYKENLKSKGKGAKEYILYLKENSPFTLVLIAFIIWNYFLLENTDGDVLVLSLVLFSILVGCCWLLIKWLLDFRVFVEFDIENNRVSAYEMSYRLQSKYKIIDEDEKESLLVYPLKTKVGDGFVVDSIDHQARKIKANRIHMNINIIPQFKESFIKLRKFAVAMQHNNNKMKAEFPQKVIIKSTELLNEINPLANIIDRIGSNVANRDILELDKLEEIEDRADKIQASKIPIKKENELNEV